MFIFNSKNIKSMYYNNQKIKAAYYNNLLVYQEKIVIDPTYNYFVFDTSTSGSDNKVELTRYRAGDKTSWDQLTYWGDGTVDYNSSHTYNKAGVYIIKTKWMLNEYDKTYNELYTTNSTFELIACNNINKNITDVSYLFNRCLRLETIDLSLLDTSNMTDMRYMFSNCSITSLDLLNFNTSNVTNMGHMFNACTVLTSLDLSSFDTSNVTDFRNMFQSCLNLSYLDISNFNMDKASYYSGMFIGCNNLTLDNIIMTNCNEATKAKITEAFNNK